jgi:hypothetical protein
VSRYRFGKPPKKGTVLRNLALMALRPQGVTKPEFMENSRHVFQTYIGVLIDQRGYDIKSFPCPPSRRAGGQRTLIYKMVGKMRWSGTYRSFNNAIIFDSEDDAK